MSAKAGIDFCTFCSVSPRHPCRDAGEASECPNADTESRENYRSTLPGYSQSEADELAEYRERFGRLR